MYYGVLPLPTHTISFSTITAARAEAEHCFEHYTWSVSRSACRPCPESRPLSFAYDHIWKNSELFEITIGSNSPSTHNLHLLSCNLKLWSPELVSCSLPFVQVLPWHKVTLGDRESLEMSAILHPILCKEASQALPRLGVRGKTGESKWYLWWIDCVSWL